MRKPCFLCGKSTKKSKGLKRTSSAKKHTTTLINSRFPNVRVVHISPKNWCYRKLGPGKTRI